MTDYTDLKAHMRRYADGCDPETVLEAVAAIAALEADVEKLTQVLAEHGVRAKKFSGTVGDNVFTNCWFFNEDSAALVQQPAADVAQENPRNPPMQG
jgi:hypothetical protein